MAQGLRGGSGLLRRPIALVTAIVLIAGLVLPAAPARAGLTDCLEAIAPIDKVAKAAEVASKVSACTGEATSDPVMAAIILVLSAMAVDGQFSSSDQCLKMVDSTVGKLIAQALVASGIVGGLDKLVPGAGAKVTAIAQGTATESLNDIEGLSIYLQCGCGVAGAPGDAEALASAYAANVKGCADVIGDVGGLFTGAVGALIPKGQCLGGCPTATGTTENYATAPSCQTGVWMTNAPIGPGITATMADGTVLHYWTPTCACPAGATLRDSGGNAYNYGSATNASQSICVYCPFGQALQNGQCGACPAPSTLPATCSLDVTGLGYSQQLASNVSYAPAPDGGSCVRGGTGGSSHVACTGGLLAAKNAGTCSCSAPACIDGALRGNICTCGAHAHVSIVANLKGNPDLGFKDVCTCDSGYERKGSDGPCKLIVTCSNPAQQADDNGKCADICPRGADYQPAGSTTNPASASVGVIGAQGTGGTHSDLPPGCVACATGAQCHCSIGSKADGNGGCQNFCGPGFRYAETGGSAAAQKSKAKKAQSDGGAANKESVPRCLACASGKTDPSDPAKCMVATLTVPDISREPRRPTKPSQIPPRTAAKPSATKPVGGEVAKPATVTCGPRMRLNSSRTGCIPDLDIGGGGSPGSTPHGVAPSIPTTRGRF